MNNGRSESRGLTWPRAGAISEQRFRQARQLLWAEWAHRISQTGVATAFSEEPDDWLARNIYAHLRCMVQQNRWQVLVHMVNDRRSLKRGLHPIENKPIKIGLVAFLGDQITMGRNRRSELTDAMEYAYVHRVQAKYFNGFVKQAGQKKIKCKLETGYVEPGFDPGKLRARPDGSQ